MAAQVNIKVNSDFAQASKDLKKFGEVSEAEAKRVKKFTESFKTEQIDKFIERNRRTGAAVQATSGDMKSLETQQRGLTRQMEALIKKGLDPQDESIERLRKEYDRLDKEVEKNINSQKGMEMATKAASKGLLAIGVAVAAVGAGAIKSTIEIGQMGDEIAKTSAKIGVSVESFQELSFAAERSGLSSGALSGVFEKLNKNVGDLQAGTGALTTFLNKSNPALLDQLKNVTDSEEAFNILTDAVANAPTEFEKAALAQAAFGRAGQDIINFANQGAEEIGKLRDEAASYGVISAEVAKKGEDFADAQRNIQQATIGARAELADRLLPTFTKALNSMAAFVADGEKLEKTLSIVGYALAGVTSALIAFLVVSKGAAAIQAMATAFKVLNAAMASNPIGAIAVAITAVLIPAIIWMIKNWDLVVVIMETTIAKLKESFSLFAVSMQTSWARTINGLKIMFFELAGVILDKVLGSINKLLDVAGKLPFIGEKFQDIQSMVNDFAGELDAARIATIDQSKATIDAAEAQKQAVKDQTVANIQRINEEKDARLAALEAQKAEEAAANMTDLEKQAQHEQAMTNLMATALSTRLETLNNVEAQAELDKLATFDKFLTARMEQEGLAGEERISFLQSELDRIRSMETLAGEEKILAEEAVAKKITEIQTQQAEAQQALLEQQLTVYAGFFGALSGLVTAFGGENREAAIAAKALAAAQAGINSYLAFTQVLADPTLPFFLKAISAATVLASGVAQQANILSTPIPSAQTGTGSSGITVPENTNSSRADSVAVMATPGETVNVSPRGEGGGGNTTINVVMNEEVLWTATQKGIDSGNITITNDNVRSAS